MTPGPLLTVHASCVVLGEKAVLIRGASGAGKSSLAIALLAHARTEGRFAAWVGDDRVLVKRVGGRLIAEPHPAIAGSFEAYGFGIMGNSNEPKAVLHLAIDLDPQIDRMPEERDLTTNVAGVALPCLPLVARRAGLYEASLVFRLLRTRRGDERHPGLSGTGELRI